MPRPLSRREFTRMSAAASGYAWLGSTSRGAQDPGKRPPALPDGVEVRNPRERVPLSLIIDDSTCLVNLAHFCIPQFAEVFPNQYRQEWRKLPREIPDSFVRKFMDWCRERGIKGKYSVIPYPACVGWLDRDLPGWTPRELEQSLELVRTQVMPDWDIHPEMISHTWVVDTKTGRPYPERTERFMENWRWTDGKSADEIANYMAYALRVLKNAGLRCDGITTPGGFGNRVLPELACATFQACRAVFSSEIPHYFRHLYTDEHSVAPRVEYASGLEGPNPSCVVSIIGCTGDWFGGWDGLERGHVDQFITPDLKGGRLPEVINRGEPAILVCHWPGMYFNGDEVGFGILREVVGRLDMAFDHLVWMNLSQIARYWAARSLTKIEFADRGLTMNAPFACPQFTLRWSVEPAGQPRIVRGDKSVNKLKEVSAVLKLQSGTWHRAAREITVCFDLSRGTNRLEFE